MALIKKQQERMRKIVENTENLDSKDKSKASNLALMADGLRESMTMNATKRSNFKGRKSVYGDALSASVHELNKRNLVDSF